MLKPSLYPPLEMAYGEKPGAQHNIGEVVYPAMPVDESPMISAPIGIGMPVMQSHSEVNLPKPSLMVDHSKPPAPLYNIVEEEAKENELGPAPQIDPM